MDGGSILVVEDDLSLQRYLLKFFSDRGYHATLVPTLIEAADVLSRNDYRFTVIDVALDADSGVSAASRLRSHARNAGAIIALSDVAMDTERPDPPDGIDWVVAKDALELELAQAVEGVESAAAAAHARTGAVPVPVPREMTLWKSKQMREVRKIIAEAAAVDVTVLIRGQTGTGKDVVARAIHALSARRAGPFVKVNCAAVPRDLLESELFGHERGAFTGAHQRKIGKFEAAHDGTIFLDEIGDLHPSLQAKLLHVLQDGNFWRIGGRAGFKVDARVLAATNQDLEGGVASGRFREDLYYRLNVIQIAVPPLCERREEIPGLVAYFVEKYAKLFGRPHFSIPQSVMEHLLQQRYRGNVRELENLVKRMIILGEPRPDRGTSRTLPERAGERHAMPSAVPLKDIVRRAALNAERDAIRDVLQENGWNRTRAAQALNISYRGLLYKIKRVGLSDEKTPRRPARTLGDDALDGSLS